MARLPIDLMTAGVRENLPDAVYQTQTATGEAFGAGVGQALQKFGDAGGQLVQHVRAYEEKQQKFDATKALIQTTDADSTEFEERKRTLSGNGAGFWQEQRDQTRKRMDAYLETLPEGLRKEFSVEAERLVAARTRQAFTTQYQQADANTRLTLDEEARKAGLQVNQDPGAYEKVQGQFDKLIDASPLTPLEKTQQKAKIRNELSFTAEQARAQQNPSAYVGSTLPGGVDGVKSLLRNKEGFREAPYWDKTALRIGYGSDTITKADGTVEKVTAETRVTREDAERDLDRRINTEFMPAARSAIGKEAFDKLSPAAQAVMVSLSYNYGAGAWGDTLKGVAEAAKTGDPNVLAAAVRARANDNGGANLARRTSEAQMVASGAGSGGAPVASRANLTADQTRAVDESARRALTQQTAQQAAANDAAVTAQRDATYVAIKEGPNPEATLKQARQSGLIGSYDQIVKAEKILEDRNKGDDDLQVGLSLMAGGRSGSNPYDKTHKDGLDAVYNAAIKGGADQSAAAAAVFDRTGVVPPSFALALRGALTKEDPSQLGPAARTAANILAQNPNALAGVEGKDQIEAAATEYQRLTQGLGLSEQDAAKRIQADARATKDPLKDEVLNQFKKDYLTVDKLNSRLQSQVGGWFGYGAKVPEGAQRSAVSSIYGAFAEEGMRQFQNPDRALAYADFKIKQQFGTQNGVITRYPPDKAGLPALEGKGHTWINEQAVDVVKDQLGVVVEPSQISFVAVTGRDGANTAQAFNNGGVDVTRSDSRPGQQSSFKSVPYQIVVMPKPGQPEAAVQVLNGAFFPDVDSYVAKANAAKTTRAAVPQQMYDQFGIPFDAPAHAPELIDTPTQAARRKQAEANAALLESQATARARQKPVTNPDEAALLDQMGAGIQFRKPGR